MAVQAVVPQAKLAQTGDVAEGAQAPSPEPGSRLVSLDAFRGLTILGMLLVNNAALDTATPTQLTHAAWGKGVHLADLVFPWFLLIVGIAIPFSAASARRRGVAEWRQDLRVFSRCAVLFGLGCLIDSSFAHRPVFGLGVLQLIALAYLLGALLYGLSTARRQIVAALLLLGHWALIRFVPIPGVGAGHFTEQQNIINHINQAYLGAVHLRGLVSVVPTCALVLIGTGMGDLLRSTLAPTRKVGALLAVGAGLMAAGWLWHLDLDFSKGVWSAPYVLYCAGWGALALVVLYALIDGAGWRLWAYPLVVLGANAMVAYVVPILTKAYILQEWTMKLADGTRAPLQDALLRLCVGHAGRVAGGWVYTIGYILVWWCALLVLYRKRVFIRV